MNKRTACALALSFLTLPALAQSCAPPAATPVSDAAAAAPVQQGPDAPALDAPADAVPAQIVVSGKRPGPGLWKVSKGEHVMWVFGLHSPLPQKMEWDAARVERLVAQSQEVLQPPSAGVSVGWFSGLTLLPSLIGMKKNPDGAALRDVVPADVYARWQGLKTRYMAEDNDVEHYRPLFASEELMQAGLKANGLSKGFEVRKQIESLAKKHDVKVVPSGFSVELENPRAAMKDFKKSQLEDVACFTKTIERFEGDIDAMRARANAWANGNIAEIRSLDYAERDDACSNATLNASFAKNNPAFQGLRERRLASWLKAAETALDKNNSTFAMLTMNEILGPKSYLAALQARGYTVESPK